MIDHVVVGVADIDAARAFYEQALRPLGLRVVRDREDYVGFGDGAPLFFLAARPPTVDVHVAFTAPDAAACDAFHAAALAAGGTDNGAPGLRPRYHAGYYGAFVRDPDGDSVEAVCHGASPATEPGGVDR
ncbi:MAG: VOC family protein [Thermoleophilia bacterium]|nr:VOC family protein [Thermoleophilia bacterium]